jgi:hypothetical protein
MVCRRRRWPTGIARHAFGVGPMLVAVLALAMLVGAGERKLMDGLRP